MDGKAGGAELSRPETVLEFSQQIERLKHRPVAESIERNHRGHEAGVYASLAFDAPVFAEQVQDRSGDQEHVLIKLDDQFGLVMELETDVCASETSFVAVAR
jgi:hypothetical protein